MQPNFVEGQEDSISGNCTCCCSFPSCRECHDNVSKMPLQDQEEQPRVHPSRKDLRRTTFTMFSKGVFLLAGFGAAFLVGSYAIFALSPVDFIINAKLSLREGSMLYNLWVKPPVNVYIKVFVFNVTNADQFLSGKEKLRLEEIGPYIYRETLENTNVTFNANNTVTYIPKRTVHPEPSMSTRDALKDRIIVPNVALLGMASMLHNSSSFLNVGLATIARYLDSQPLLNLSVHEVLWGYDDPLVRLASTVLPNWISFSRLGLMDRMFDEGENVVTMTLESKKDTEAEAQGRHRRIYSFDSYNGWSNLRQWSGQACSSLKGVSEGILYPRRISTNDSFLIYRKAFCRILPVEYDRSGITKDGFPAYWFRLPENVFDSPDKNPDNACYCRSNVAPCLMSGLADITPCYYSIPVALSFPHFLKGDPRLVENLEGLSPDPEKHDSIIVIQQDLGLPMAVSSKMQLNLVVHNTRLNPRAAMFNNQTLPIFWIDWNFEMPESVSNIMYVVLYVAPAIQIAIVAVLALVGVAMLGLAACSCSKKNTAVASKILSKSQHLLEKNAAEQLLINRTHQRIRDGKGRS